MKAISSATHKLARTHAHMQRHTQTHTHTHTHTHRHTHTYTHTLTYIHIHTHNTQHTRANFPDTPPKDDRPHGDRLEDAADAHALVRLTPGIQETCLPATSAVDTTPPSSSLRSSEERANNNEGASRQDVEHTGRICDSTSSEHQVCVCVCVI